jgi:hypothetical protein
MDSVDRLFLESAANQEAHTASSHTVDRLWLEAAANEEAFNEFPSTHLPRVPKTEQNQPPEDWWRREPVTQRWKSKRGSLNWEDAGGEDSGTEFDPEMSHAEVGGHHYYVMPNYHQDPVGERKTWLVEHFPPGQSPESGDVGDQYGKPADSKQWGAHPVDEYSGGFPSREHAQEWVNRRHPDTPANWDPDTDPFDPRTFGASLTPTMDYWDEQGWDSEECPECMSMPGEGHEEDCEYGHEYNRAYGGPAVEHSVPHYRGTNPFTGVPYKKDGPQKSIPEAIEDMKLENHFPGSTGWNPEMEDVHDPRFGKKKQAWSGWGPSQFPKHHKVADWDWNNHLNGYVSKTGSDFQCECGDTIPVPSFKLCSCGRQWNSYGIGTGGDLHTANTEMFLCREIPVREGVIVANSRMSGEPGYPV